MEAAKETDQAQAEGSRSEGPHQVWPLPSSVRRKVSIRVSGRNWGTLEPAESSNHRYLQGNLGYHTRQHQDWFDENDVEIEQLINEKRMAFCAWQNDIICNTKREAHTKVQAEDQHKTRELKNKWWTEKEQECQHFVDTHNQDLTNDGEIYLPAPHCACTKPTLCMHAPPVNGETSWNLPANGQVDSLICQALPTTHVVFLILLQLFMSQLVMA